MLLRRLGPLLLLRLWRRRGGCLQPLASGQLQMCLVLASLRRRQMAQGRVRTALKGGLPHV